MSGLARRVFGGALAGAGQGIVQIAQDKRQNALLAIQQQNRLEAQTAADRAAAERQQALFGHQRDMASTEHTSAMELAAAKAAGRGDELHSDFKFGEFWNEDGTDITYISHNEAVRRGLRLVHYDDITGERRPWDGPAAAQQDKAQEASGPAPQTPPPASGGDDAAAAFKAGYARLSREEKKEFDKRTQGADVEFKRRLLENIMAKKKTASRAAGIGMADAETQPRDTGERVGAAQRPDLAQPPAGPDWMSLEALQDHSIARAPTQGVVEREVPPPAAQAPVSHPDTGELPHNLLHALSGGQTTLRRDRDAREMEAMRRGAQGQDAGNGLLGRLRRTARQALDAGGEPARVMIEQLNLAAQQGIEAAQIVLNELADVAGGIAEVGGRAAARIMGTDVAGAAARIMGTDAAGGAIAGGRAVLNENAAAMARRGNAALSELPPFGGGAVGQSVEPLPGGGLPAAARDAAEMEAVRDLPHPYYPLSRFIAEYAPERKDIANRAQSAFKSFQQMMREAVNGRDASPPLADDTFIAGNGLAARIRRLDEAAQPAPEFMAGGARLRPPRPVEWRNLEADKNPPRPLVENGTVPDEYVRGRDPAHVPVNIAQNNPLNVENRGQKFQGSIALPGQRFYGFKTPLAGIRAASRVLRQYQRGKPRKMWDGTTRKPETLRDVIYTWAPKGENESEAYAGVVSEWSGIPIDAQIDTQDDAIQLRIIPAMIFVESGKTEQPYGEALIKRAIAASHYPSGQPVAQAPGAPAPAG